MKLAFPSHPFAILVLAMTTLIQVAMAQPVPVEVAQLRMADVPLTLDGLGAVQALNTVTLRAHVDGILQQIRFREGQEVQAGDVLVQIDPRPHQAALDQALAREAATSGDRIMAEAYWQYADHYYRLIQAAGGFTPRGQRSRAEVTRQIDDRLGTASVPLTYPVQPGDTIVIKERWF